MILVDTMIDRQVIGHWPRDEAENRAEDEGFALQLLATLRLPPPTGRGKIPRAWPPDDNPNGSLMSALSQLQNVQPKRAAKSSTEGRSMVVARLIWQSTR